MINEQLKSIIMMPGAGEHVYDTKIAYEADGSPINAHFGKKADVLLSLDSLKQNYPNVKNIGLVVGWFGDSTNGGKTHIAPKVEHKKTYKGDVWSVGSVTRKNAEQISLDDSGEPNWGGTPSDRSIVDLVVEMESRGYDVMLYPMLFTDNEDKSWRGEITAKSKKDVDHFFNEYNKFIEHYAKLEYGGVKIKDHISSFIVGSEMEGLTKNPYAVDKFVELTAKVRKAVGADVKLTYAANWSEYHDDGRGNHPLDKLFADKNIDFVGIDAYFPITDNMKQKDITPEIIKHGWESGIDFDYWRDDNGKKHKLDAAYAVKNIEYWWSHKHYDENGKVSAWQPKMKPVVFTEFGFTSVDGTTNEPSKYYDPTTEGAGFPKGSAGLLDYNAQRMAMEATEEFWTEKSSERGNEGLASTRYAYSWDARPIYHKQASQYWGDNEDWQYGHWLKPQGIYADEL